MTLAPPVGPLLADLAAAGIDLVADGDRLRFRPVAAMTPALLGRVRASKPALLKALSAPGSAVEECPAPIATGRWSAPALRCYCCGHARWWRFPGQHQWTCEACHPAFYRDEVEWLGADGGPTP